MSNVATSTQPGQLDRRVTLRSATRAADALGQMVATWGDAATVWGAWSPVTGREISAAGQLQPQQIGTLRIRHRSDIDATWRVVLGSITFEIIAPPVEIGRRAFLDLSLRALASAAA